MPDPSTMAVLPWRPSTGRVARLFCRLHTASGEPFELDARRILKDTVKSLREKELSVFFGAECEFYLFKNDENGEPTDIPLDCGGYLDLAPADRGENVRREICFTLQEMGIKPESSHHENGPGQNEIDFCAADPLTAADHVTTFKNVVQTVAQKNGLHARFDPKPLDEADGNGLHINVRVASGDAAKNKAFLARNFAPFARNDAVSQSRRIVLQAACRLRLHEKHRMGLYAFRFDPHHPGRRKQPAVRDLLAGLFGKPVSCLHAAIARRFRGNARRIAASGMYGGRYAAGKPARGSKNRFRRRFCRKRASGTLN